MLMEIDEISSNERMKSSSALRTLKVGMNVPTRSACSSSALRIRAVSMFVLPVTSISQTMNEDATMISNPMKLPSTSPSRFRYL